MEDYDSDEWEGPSEWTFYKDRPEWADVKPTPQDDGPHPVVQITYSDKFRDVFDYFRTILRTNEKSERALKLTTDAAEMNPANYTVWHYRRLLLKELDKNLKDEMFYVGDMIKEHPKTYQLWHHRRVLIEWLQDASNELQFTEEVLEIDAKNYHAWQHRQWAISTFEMSEKELDYINRLLEEDVRNNSAWNQRYFIINITTKFTDDVLDQEVKYTIGCIRKAVHNESAWNYLSGILFEKNVSKQTQVVEFTSEMYESGERSSYLLAFIVDSLENQLELKCDDPEIILRKALDLCSSLAKEYDTIRSEYWKYMARCLAEKYGSSSSNAHAGREGSSF